MTKIPKVYFLYAYPLDSERRYLFETRGDEYPTIEVVKSETERIRSMWTEINKDYFIINKIIEILGVNPGYDFEVYIYGAGLQAMSVPLLLPLFYKNGKINDNKIIETIIHELLHRFNGGARPTDYSTDKYWDYIYETYNSESKLAKNHILIYAVLHKILPLIMSEDDMGIVFNEIGQDEYKRALEIVKQNGADFHIKEFTDRLESA